MLNKLQKADKDTNDLINQVKEYLFSIGIRTSRERAWDIFQTVHQMPYLMLVERNPEIEYQGVGQHISHNKHGNQFLAIKSVGRFELKGVSSKREQKKKAAVKFMPSAEMKKLVAEKVKVKE